MMSNRDTAVALDYHSATNHTLQRLSEWPRTLDPANRPLPYKIYSSLPPIPLPVASAPSADALFSVLASPAIPASGEQIPNLQALAQLCIFSNGVTKTLRRAGREFPMRAAATTGALFHIEMYLVCGDLPDLAAGVYHYGAHDNALRQIRAGDFRRFLIEATGAEAAISAAPVVVIYTSTFWRNAYKYGARAYRHAFWDGGTILANSLTLASSLALPSRVVLGFVDAQVNALLDVDGEHEAALSLLALGHTTQEPAQAPPVVPLALPTAQLSMYEVAYPPIAAIQRASSLATPEEVVAWRGRPAQNAPRPKQPLIPLRPVALSELPGDSVTAVIKRRGSTRRFTHESIDFVQLSTILSYALRSIAADYRSPDEAPLSSLYLIANAVEDLAHGTYVLHQDRQALEQLQAGTFRHAAKTLALGQDLGGDAAVNLYFLVDLVPVLARYGNRGYRVAQLEAAILAGKIYLVTYALSLGATGLTFFDEDVTTFFSPHAAGRSVLFLIALGRPWKETQG